MSPVEILAYCATLIAWIGQCISGVIDIFNLFNEGGLLCKDILSGTSITAQQVLPF